MLFSGMRISTAPIKANHEFRGPKIAERLREEKWAVRSVNPKLEFCCETFLAAEP